MCNNTGSSGTAAMDARVRAALPILANGQANVEALTEGQVVHETFTATVTDDFGASATQVVTLTVTGTNDSPVITTAAAPDAGAVIEAGHVDAAAAERGSPPTAGTLA